MQGAAQGDVSHTSPVSAITESASKDNMAHP
jgi:hypothetical protein